VVLRADVTAAIVAALRAPRPGVTDVVLPSRAEPALDLVGAYELQRAVTARREEDGDRVVGWKVGLVDPAAQRRAGTDEPIAGRLFAGQRIAPGGSFAPTGAYVTVVECEVAFVVGRELAGPGRTLEDVVDAISGVAAAFEVIEQRLPEHATLADAVADNASGRAFVTGRVVPLTGFDRVGTSVEMTVDGRTVSTGVTGDVLGDPALALVWLAGHLAVTGEHLRAGDVVLTGAACRPLTLGGPCVVGASYGSGLGALELVVLPCR
jgi:2-keto-4-pentenoate hydratase